MSNGSEVLIYLSFLLKEDVFQLLLQLQTIIWLLCIFIYKNQKLSFSHFILFYNSKNRHLEFQNLSPQGLISSTVYGQVVCLACQLQGQCITIISTNHAIWRYKTLRMLTGQYKCMCFTQKLPTTHVSYVLQGQNWLLQQLGIASTRTTKALSVIILLQGYMFDSYVVLKQCQLDIREYQGFRSINFFLSLSITRLICTLRSDLKGTL